MIKSKKDTNPFYFQETAQAFCDEALWSHDSLTYKAVHWNNMTYLYDGRRYFEVSDKELNSRLRRWLMSKGIPQNNQLVGNVSPIIETLIGKNRQTYPAMPFYCGQDIFPDARNIIAYRNGLLDVGAYLNGKPALLPHTPLWISANCLPYDYDPSATCPQWLAFLRQVFEGAEEQIDLSQEYMGYCLTQDTSLQKFLTLIGQGAAGKGTWWEVAKHLYGVENAGAFSLYQFAYQFGLWGLVDKSVAYCGEAEVKWDGKGRILETLKAITGQDLIHIDRKGIAPIDIVLPTRLVIACNGFPSLFETTDALARRLLVLRFTRSFQGREDTRLKDKLLMELGGINNWALQGLARLRANGRFTMTETTKQEINEIRRDNSPILAFIQDCLMVNNRLNAGNLVNTCLTDEEISTTKGKVDEAYGLWCRDVGLDPMLACGEVSAQVWKMMKGNLSGLKGRGRGKDKVYYGIQVKGKAEI